MNNPKKEECVFVGPVFGGYWVPISEVEPIEIKDQFGVKRMTFYYKGKKMESGIVKK